MEKAKKVAKYTEASTLAEALAHPKGTIILMKHNVPCPHCPMMAQESGHITLGQIAKTYNLDLKALLEALNQKNREE
jgi:hypothetical protein